MAPPNLDFIPKVDKCCCLLELPVGSLIIGIVELLLPGFFFGYHSHGYSCGGGSCTGVWAYYVWIILYVLFVISAIFVIITYIAPKQKDLLLAAVIIQLILIILHFIMAIIIFVLLFIDEVITNAIISLVVGLILLALFAYFVCVLHSWYKTL